MVVRPTGRDQGRRARNGRALHTRRDQSFPANYATPLHVHRREDEAFWILDGEAVFDVGGETFDASAGSYLLAPRGVAHRFTAGARGARILFLFTPAGFERYIEATSVAARRPTVPPADVTPPENVAEIARAFGTEILDDTTPAPERAHE